MSIRAQAAVVAACMLVLPLGARADNPMGYRLLLPQQAAGLPRNQGALGMDVERGQQITSGGMTFTIITVTLVRSRSAAGAAGIRPGDDIIALNGQVFPTLVAFAAYVGSLQPGSQATIDYVPRGGGLKQAQRVAVTVGRAG